MSEKEKKIEITSESVEKDLHIDKRPADKWMKQTKYKIYMDLVDQAYELQFEPDIKGLAKKYDLSEITVKRYINTLRKEGLLNKIKNKVNIPHLFVGRKGQPICAFCGSELEDVKEKVTKNGYYVLSGKCPVCVKGTGQFRTKAKIEGE